MATLKVWLLASRPKTLTAAVVPVIAASALTVAMGFEFHFAISFLALMSSVFIQIGTNLVNDAADFEKGADRETRLGPTRVTQAGLLSAKQVWRGAGISFFFAAGFALPLVLKGGVVILILGLLSLVAGWAYTAGPFPLAYRGLGDFFVILFFGLIAVTGIFYLQTNQWNTEAALLGLQVGLHCAVLIAINNLRDIESDRKANKRTLPVRFGKNFGRFEILFLCVAPFALQVFWFLKGWNLALALPFLIIPLAIVISKAVFTNEPGQVYNSLLAKAAGLHLGFGLLLSLGFLL